MKQIRVLNKQIGDCICAMGASQSHINFLLSKEIINRDKLNEALINQMDLLTMIENLNNEIIKLTNE